MFCASCGEAIEEYDRFCRACGGAVHDREGRPASLPCRRPKGERMVAGVCAGLSAHFGKDATIVRIVWTVAALIPPLFPGLSAYIVCWLLMPPDTAREQASAAAGEVTSLR